MTNPLIAILSSDKLAGENFVKCTGNMNIVLVCENKFGLIDKCPVKPLLMHSELLGMHMIVGFLPTKKPATSY